MQREEGSAGMKAGSNNKTTTTAEQKRETLTILGKHSKLLLSLQQLLRASTIHRIIMFLPQSAQY